MNLEQIYEKSVRNYSLLVDNPKKYIFKAQFEEIVLNLLEEKYFCFPIVWYYSVNGLQMKIIIVAGVNLYRYIYLNFIESVDTLTAWINETLVSLSTEKYLLKMIKDNKIYCYKR